MKSSKYSEIIKEHELAPNYGKNMLSAFIFGGLICLFGQILIWIYTNWFDMSDNNAATLMIVVIILLSSILTGLGVYDRFGQIAKAGAFIPISGFANSLTSAALEGKSEGIVLGIATSLFKLAGAVIVFAIVSGFVFGLIRYFLVEMGVAPALDHVAYVLSTTVFS